MFGHESWPIDPAVLIPFVIAVAMVEITPGPNMAYLATLSAMHGKRAGLLAVAGVTTGLAIYMIASVIGITGIFRTSPLAYEVLRWCGVLFLFWLAFEAWSGRADTSPGHARDLDQGLRPFVRGLVANLLNVKAAIFYITLLPSFIAPDHGPPYRQALILGSAHLVISVIVHGAIVLGAAHATSVLRAAREGPRGKWVRACLAAGIALTGVWLLWETRQ